MTQVELRGQVLELRIRLERCAAEAFDRVCAPARTGVQRRIAARLLFVVAAVPATRQAEVHRLARLAGHVYQRTSHVLHGRTSGLNPSPAVVAEWRAVVDAVEDVLTA